MSKLRGEEVYELRLKLAAAEAERDQYKTLYNHALDNVDAIFQTCKKIPKPLLPDFLKAGEDKFRGCVLLAQAYKEVLAERDRLKAIVAKLRDGLDKIVIEDGEDAGVILLSDESPTHYSPLVKGRVYDYENFSPLGDALVALAKLTREAAEKSKENK